MVNPMHIENVLTRKLATLWTRLNPVEPSTAYLVKLMALFIILIVLAGIIGKLG